MSAGADNSDVAGALEGETVDGTPLPRSFLVEASGPATIVRDHGDITERTEGTVEISHRIETLEEFGEFWALRSKRHPERTAVNKLLNAQDEGMGARCDQVGEWDDDVWTDEAKQAATREIREHWDDDGGEE
jgi:hypothetical protein